MRTATTFSENIMKPKFCLRRFVSLAVDVKMAGHALIVCVVEEYGLNAVIKF